MMCPYCAFEGSRGALHAHLTDSHGEECAMTESWGNRFYRLDCPLCDASLRRQVKPRLRDPTFLEEYGREIRIVAFDQFLYHLQTEHEEAAGA